MYKNIIKISALFLMMLFFFPTILVSCDSEEIEISALEIGIGTVFSEDKTIQEMNEDIDPWPAAFIMLILSFIIIMAGDRNLAVVIICAIGNIATIIWMHEAVKDFVVTEFGGFASTSTTIWYTVYIAIACVIVFASIISKFYPDDRAGKYDGIDEEEVRVLIGQK